MTTKVYEVQLNSHGPCVTRFHPDDIVTALGVLCAYMPRVHHTLREYREIEEAFTHAILSLDASITRREKEELDEDVEAIYLYERARAIEAQIEARHRTEEHLR